MDAELRITSTSFDEMELRAFSMQMRDALTAEEGVSAKLKKGKAIANSRGEPFTLGVLALTFLTSGAAVASLEVFKAFFSRDTSLEVEFEHKGKVMKLRSQNMKPKEIEKTLALAKDYFSANYQS